MVRALRVNTRPMDRSIPHNRMAAKKRKQIELELQGGGAHGAFTWGVLDRIFEDGRIWIEAISGASAGAMNAVVAAHGEERGLRRLPWERIAPTRVHATIRRPIQPVGGPQALVEATRHQYWVLVIRSVVCVYSVSVRPL